MAGGELTVILADDHAVVRAGLRAILGTAPDITVVGEANDGARALALVEQLVPDVAIMDLSMPVMDGAEATRAIVAQGLRTRVLILTMHVEEEYLLPLLEAGAAGYLVKSAADVELVKAVRAIAHGDAYVSASASSVLINGLRKKDPAKAMKEKYNALTQRERDVLRLIAQGFSAPEIGEQLFISPKTVDSYKQRINEKLSISHRSDYVEFALAIGLMGTSQTAIDAQAKRNV
ncbi:MAG: response regulator transcription factor [Gemmatimonadaceae bacterium]